MQHEHRTEQERQPPSTPTAAAREYWVRVAIDGTPQVVRIVARSAQDALRRFPQDLHRGGRLRYATTDGELIVEWSNVATLAVGPIIRIVRIAPDDGP